MKTSNFPPLFLILILIIAVGCIRQENHPNSLTATATSSSIQVAVTPENLEFLDFNFTSINPADPRLKKAITQDQAIKSALKFKISWEKCDKHKHAGRLL